MEDETLVYILFIWFVLLCFSILIIQTWVENQLYYIREKESPKEQNGFIGFIAVATISATIIIPILLFYLK